MKTAPTETGDQKKLLVYVFGGVSSAEKARHAIYALDRQVTAARLGNIAVVRRAAGGKVSVRESADLPYRARIASVLPFLGMVAGFLAQERGVLKTSANAAAMAGGALGLVLAMTINVVDLGFSDTGLEEVGRQLDYGTSALITLSTPDEQQTLSTVLNRAGGTAMEDALSPAVTAKVRSTLHA